MRYIKIKINIIVAPISSCYLGVEQWSEVVVRLVHVSLVHEGMGHGFLEVGNLHFTFSFVVL